jgi:uncharacterized protein YndB with AHSA1/START domain
MRRSCEASILIEAPVQTVWDVVSDVTRVGEWSGECQSCTWLDGAVAPVRGARFRGRNRRGGMRWARLNEVTEVAPPHTLVWRTVPHVPYFDSTEWQLTLTEEGPGTRVAESFRILRLSKPEEWVFSIVMPAHRDRSVDLTSDLDRLKSLLEVRA